MSAIRATFEAGIRIRPSHTYEEFLKAMPGSKHTPQTYASFQLARREVPAAALAKGTGTTFKVTRAGNPDVYEAHKGHTLRIVHIGENWVWAVPASFVENFWQ